jgi:hypothetical protein
MLNVTVDELQRDPFKYLRQVEAGVTFVIPQLDNGEEVIEMYLEAWQAEGETIPEPRTLQVA